MEKHGNRVRDEHEIISTDTWIKGFISELIDKDFKTMVETLEGNYTSLNLIVPPKSEKILRMMFKDSLEIDYDELPCYTYNEDFPKNENDIMEIGYLVAQVVSVYGVDAEDALNENLVGLTDYMEKQYNCEIETFSDYFSNGADVALEDIQNENDIIVFNDFLDDNIPKICNCDSNEMLKIVKDNIFDGIYEWEDIYKNKKIYLGKNSYSNVYDWIAKDLKEIVSYGHENIFSYLVLKDYVTNNEQYQDLNQNINYIKTRGFYTKLEDKETFVDIYLGVRDTETQKEKQLVKRS
jgi:hypothetical protein